MPDKRHIKPVLAGMKVVLSGAMPDRDDLESNGWNELAIRMAVSQFVEAIILRRGRIIHGNHPTYLPLVAAAVRSQAQGKLLPHPVKMYVVGPWVTAEGADKLKRENEDYAHLEFIGPFDSPTWDEDIRQTQKNTWLQVMREKMAAEGDALICIGGRGIRPEVLRPGVEVEAALMRLAHKPVFVAAGFGGFAGRIRALGILSESQQNDNCLTLEENLILEGTADPARVVELILKGLQTLNEKMQVAFPTTPGQTQNPAAVAGSGDVVTPPDDKFAGNKDSHLQMIQGVINRMGQNSFSLKGWAVTLAGGLFAIGAGDANHLIGFTAIPVCAAFWYLDAYYLCQERRYRALYDRLRLDPAATTDYSMNTSILVNEAEEILAQKDPPQEKAEAARRLFLGNCFWSVTERWFYLCVLAAILAMSLVLIFIPPKSPHLTPSPKCWTLEQVLSTENLRL